MAAVRTRPASMRAPRAATLLHWFAAHRRPLPWRADRDPYRIWVAEVLLQQTRVAQAVPYYERFLRRFPTVAALAEASEDDVLKAWEGAGYYARARHLHAAARGVVRDRGGVLPTTAAAWRELPGVGPYIAAAVASLAFGTSDLALEANGWRVGARLALVTGDVRSPRTQRTVRRFLAGIAPSQAVGAFNEALMELGETVCTPVAPRCAECPWADACRARHELTDPGVLPRRSAPPRRPLVEGAVVAVRRRGRWLVQRRPPSGLLGGLWELPGGKLERGETADAAARRELAEETGLAVVGPLRELGVVEHAYSHFRVRLHVFLAERTTGRLRVDAAIPRRWLTGPEFSRRPRPKATEKVMRLLAGR